MSILHMNATNVDLYVRIKVIDVSYCRIFEIYFRKKSVDRLRRWEEFLIKKYA
jgi:hypothetical protein